MTEAEQRAAEEELIRFQQENPNYWGDQDENGVDLARLRENLKRTPAERIRQGGMAYLLAGLLEKSCEPHRTTDPSRSSLSERED
jgi:hypothetical protein